VQVLTKAMPKGREKKGQNSDVKILATGGTMASVTQKPPSANTGISPKVVRAPIGLMSVRKGEREQLEPCAKRPHYTQGLLWDNEDDVLSATARYYLTAALVP